MVKELLRGKIYENVKILIIDLEDTIKEITIFVNEKLIPMLKNNEDCSKFIFNGIELRKEGENIVWAIHDKDEIKDSQAIEFDKYNINNFEGIQEFRDNLNEKGIFDFPKDLYGMAFMSLADVVSDLIVQDKLWESTDIFGLFTLDNNEKNNIIY